MNHKENMIQLTNSVSRLRCSARCEIAAVLLAMIRREITRTRLTCVEMSLVDQYKKPKKSCESIKSLENTTLFVKKAAKNNGDIKMCSNQHLEM